MLKKLQNEYGMVSINYTLRLEYTKQTSQDGQSIKVDVRKEIELQVDPKWDLVHTDSYPKFFQKIAQFQKNGNRLLREVKRLLERGQSLHFSISAACYEHVEEYLEQTPLGPMQSRLNPVVYNQWDYSGDGQAETDGYGPEDGDDPGGLHLLPDTRYTNENHDIWIPWKKDILQVFEEAEI